MKITIQQLFYGFRFIKRSRLLKENNLPAQPSEVTAEHDIMTVSLLHHNNTTPLHYGRFRNSACSSEDRNRNRETRPPKSSFNLILVYLPSKNTIQQKGTLVLPPLYMRKKI